MATKVTPEEIETFKALPDDALVTTGMVGALLDCSETTTWRLFRAGRLQRVMVTGKMVRVRVGDVRQFMAALAATA